MPDNDFRFRLSQEGDAVRQQLILDETRPHLKVQTNQDPPHAGIINLIFTGGVSYSGKTILYQFAHGYDHRPSVQGLAVVTVGGNDRSSMLPFDSGLAKINMEADEDNVYLYIEPYIPPYTPPVATFAIRYQIYVDEAS